MDTKTVSRRVIDGNLNWRKQMKNIVVGRANALCLEVARRAVKKALGRGEIRFGHFTINEISHEYFLKVTTVEQEFQYKGMAATFFCFVYLAIECETPRSKDCWRWFRAVLHLKKYCKGFRGQKIRPIPEFIATYGDKPNLSTFVKQIYSSSKGKNVDHSIYLTFEPGSRPEHSLPPLSTVG